MTAAAPERIKCRFCGERISVQGAAFRVRSHHPGRRRGGPWCDGSGLKRKFAEAETCTRCGHETGGCPTCGVFDTALGGADTDGRRYCHTNTDDRPSCYQLAAAFDTTPAGLDTRVAAP